MNGSNHNTDDFIHDDTSVGLVEETGFQSFSANSNDSEKYSYYSEPIEELETDKVSLSRNPFLRLGIGAFVLVCVLFGAVLMSGRQEPQIVEEPAKEEVLELTLGETEEQPNPSQAEEIDRMRSELALLEQQAALSEIDRDSSVFEIPADEDPKTLVTNSPSNVRTEPRPVPGSATSPTPARSTVRPAPSPAPARSRPAPNPAPVHSAARPVSRPPVSRPPAPRPATTTLSSAPVPVDPQDAWIEASNAGIFGYMPMMEVQDEPATVVSSAPAESQYQLRNASFEEVVEGPIYTTQRPTRSVPGLTHSGPSLIPMGSLARATVTTPIVWLSKHDQFMIEIQEDIFDQANRIAIPAGSAAVVQPVEVNEDSGFAELAVVGLVIGDEIIPVDYQSISIRGEDGDPLIAERYGDIGRGIAANDLEMFVIGALGGVGEILTRPDSQSITSGAFGSSSSTEYGDRNLLGGILSGGTEQLIGRMGDRNQYRLDELRSREKIFYLPEGKQVVFYVNTSFTL